MNHEFYRLKPLLANWQTNWLVGGREGGRERLKLTQLLNDISTHSDPPVLSCPAQLTPPDILVREENSGFA